MFLCHNYDSCHNISFMFAIIWTYANIYNCNISMFFNTFKKTIIVQYHNRLLFLYNIIHIFLN